MPHRQAVLTMPHHLLGDAGTVMSIATIEAHFGTTLDANAGIGYRCAGCAVAVAAVIVKPKAGSLRASPASHFRALHEAHAATCRSESDVRGGAHPAPRVEQEDDSVAQAL
jgi:hypothetical protein